MSNVTPLSFEELAAAEARSAAFAYVSEAFAEAVLDGIDIDAFAEAAFSAAFRELVARHGEAHAIRLAEGLPERIKSGEYTAYSRQ